MTTKSQQDNKREQSYWTPIQDSVALAKKQTYRSVEQNREPRKESHTNTVNWSLTKSKGNTMEQRQSF